MKIIRILAVAVASMSIASSAHAVGFGCGMTSCNSCYDCNFADSLWVGYQPTEPVYMPSCGSCCGGVGLFPRLAGKFHGGCAAPVCAAPCCDTGCGGGGGWYHFGSYGDNCGLGAGCIGSHIGGLFGKLRGHGCGDCVDSCDTCFPHTGIDLNFGCTDSGCTSGSSSAGCAAGGCAGGNQAAPAVEGQTAPPSDAPVIESHPGDAPADPAAPPMIEQDTSFPPSSNGPFDAATELHETTPPAKTAPATPAGQPAELLPPSESKDESLDGEV